MRKYNFLIGGSKKDYPERYIPLKALKNGDSFEAKISNKSQSLLVLDKDGFIGKVLGSKELSDNQTEICLILNNFDTVISSEEELKNLISKDTKCKIYDLCNLSEIMLVAEVEI